MSIRPLSIQQLQAIAPEFQKDCPNLNWVGKLTRESTWNHYFNAFRDCSAPRLLELIQKINQTLAEEERKGVKIFDLSQQDSFLVDAADRYRRKKKIYLDAAASISRQVDKLKYIPKELAQACCEMDCRAVGLRYSLGVENGGLDPLDQPDQESLELLVELAKGWKRKQPFGSDNLDELQLERLKELATYPKWVKVVVKNPCYLAEVFNWSLHCFQSAEILVKNYEMRRMIKASFLAPNIGFANNIHLTKREDEVLAYRQVATSVDFIARRVLTIPIYHGPFDEFEVDQQERINILNPLQVIHFKHGNYFLTVEEFFSELRAKKYRETNITLSAEMGFANFHPVKGKWNADFQQNEMSLMTEENWTDHIPPSRIASHEELVAQYGDKVKERDFFFKVMATRQTPNLSALDCHAYFQLYFRMKDGNWKVLSIGFYAYRFPQGLMDGLSLFAGSVRRVVALLDQNCYYAQRQRGGYPIFCSKAAEKVFLDRLFNMIHEEGVFQFAGRNCAYNVQTLIENLIEEGLIPEIQVNYFKMPMEKTRVGIAPIDRLLAWSEHCSEWVKWLVLTLLHTLLGSHQSVQLGQTQYSLSEFIQKHGQVIYNPAYLLSKIEEDRKVGEGPLSAGEIYWSQTEEKFYQKEVSIG